MFAPGGKPGRGQEVLVHHHYEPRCNWETLTILFSIHKGADQPAHMRSLISAFVIPYLKSKVTKVWYLLILSFILSLGLQHD